MNIGQFLQQGDVLIEKVSEIKGKKLNHLVLAEGETSGHMHAIKEGNADLYEENGVMYLKVMDDEIIVKHEEHKPVIIPKGDYIVRKVKEYDYFIEEARNVAD